MYCKCILKSALLRFKAVVTIGDHNGHVGLDVKCSKAFVAIGNHKGRVR